MLNYARKIGLIVLLLLSFGFVVNAQSGINPSNPQGWTFGTFGTAPTTSYDDSGWFVNVSVSNSKSILTPPVVNVALGSVFPFSYEVEKLAGPGGTTWYVNFYVDLDGNGTCDKRFDFAPSQSVGTASFNGDTTGWTQRSTCFGPNVSEGAVNMATIVASNPSAMLIGAAFNMGDTASNYVGWSGYLSSVTIAGSTYTFGPLIAPDGTVIVVRLPLDNRINNFDAAAPIAAYKLAIGEESGLIVYEIGSDSHGVGVLVVTPEEIAAVPELPETNTLIAETTTDNLVIMFWRLTSGEFQINVIQPNGKMYVLIFTVLDTGGGGYTSFEYTME